MRSGQHGTEEEEEEEEAAAFFGGEKVGGGVLSMKTQERRAFKRHYTVVGRLAKNGRGGSCERDSLYHPLSPPPCEEGGPGKKVNLLSPAAATG